MIHILFNLPSRMMAYTLNVPMHKIPMDAQHLATLIVQDRPDVVLKDRLGLFGFKISTVEQMMADLYETGYARD